MSFSNNPHSMSSIHPGLDASSVTLLSDPVRRYLEFAINSNSARAYNADLEHFRANGGQLPCSPEFLARYIAEHGDKLKVSTLVRRLSSLAKAHRLANLPDPTKSELVKTVLRGIKRAHGSRQEQASSYARDVGDHMLQHRTQPARHSGSGTVSGGVRKWNATVGALLAPSRTGESDRRGGRTAAPSQQN
jgi:hypothetical protein